MSTHRSQQVDMQIPSSISPKQPDVFSCGVYSVMSLTHLLDRCRPGVLWNEESQLPEVIAPRPSEGPRPEDLDREARFENRVNGSPRHDALWQTHMLETRLHWYQQGDVQACKALYRVHLALALQENCTTHSGTGLQAEVDAASRHIPDTVARTPQAARCVQANASSMI